MVLVTRSIEVTDTPVFGSGFRFTSSSGPAWSTAVPCCAAAAAALLPAPAGYQHFLGYAETHLVLALASTL